jgi:hypothetical protein
MSDCLVSSTEPVKVNFNQINDKTGRSGVKVDAESSEEVAIEDIVKAPSIFWSSPCCAQSARIADHISEPS